jgi:membrane associated rhomboid family serine protease
VLTIGIIVVTCIVSFAAFRSQAVFDKLCLHPYMMERNKGEQFRFISVGFIHADVGHLLFNMLTLYFFGSQLEKYIFTESQFVLFYLSAIALSCAADYANHKEDADYRACGASGGVSAMLFALVLFQPWGVVYIKFIIPIYFILFAVGYLVYSYYMAKKNAGRIAHNIHLWGALYGLAFTLICKPESLSIFLALIKKPPFL